MDSEDKIWRITQPEKIMIQQYINAVRLLLDVAPIVFESPYFAMKGGTALNLFVQNLPRLSVDIDVVFTDHLMTRDAALETISSNLNNSRQKIERMGHSARMQKTQKGENIKLLVENGLTQVKVEVNIVFRGTVLPVEKRPMMQKSQDLFTTAINLPILAVSELYGSKLVAAMDRQHPRDLFDVMCMYDQFGLTPEIVDCFVAYLVGHNRPIHEVLFSRDTLLDHIFESDFVGMTNEPLVLQNLLEIRRRMKKELPLSLTENHRSFLLSFVRGKPDWELMSFLNLPELPAIRWKLQNLEKLRKSNPIRFAVQHGELLHQFDKLRSERAN